MTEDRLPLAELLAKAGDGDFLRGVAEAVVQLLMETDLEGVIGAGRHERTGDRTTYRNGDRDRALDARLGSLQLRIPKLRQGSYFPSFLEPRKTTEKALVAVIIAVAANTDGKREIVGLHIGPSEAETFWSSFLKSLVRRGLQSVKLVISDAHEGLKAAIRRVMGASWQRCRVHWMRNALSYVPKG